MSLFALILDAVSKITKAKLKSKIGFSDAENKGDAVWLLESLEDIMTNFEDEKPKILAMDDQMERIMRMKQGENTTNEDFFKQINKHF